MPVTGTPVVQATTTPSSAFPPKPQHWAIFPGKLFLATATSGSSDANRAGTRVMTQLEIMNCEIWAWEDIIRGLAGKFDTCDWGIDPPHGLERDWNMLASAYYLQMEGGGMTVEGRLSAVCMAYIDRVHSDLVAINAGMLVLVDSQCKPIRPDPAKTGQTLVGIAGPEITLFAGMDNEPLDNTYVGGSLQEIQRLHGRSSISYGLQYPVAG